MSKIISKVKSLFAKKRIVDLFENDNNATLAELGGNYCSDSC